MDATVSSPVETHDGSTSECPRWLAVCLFAVMATGSVVLVEPAPYDILFPALMVFAWLMGQPLVSRTADSFAYFGLALYLVANCVSAVFTQDVGAAVKSTVVTGYLIVSWFFLVAIISRHGLPLARWVVRGYLAATILTVAVGILAGVHLLPNSDFFIIDGRVRSTFKSSLVFSPFVVAAIVLLFTDVIIEKRRQILRCLLIVATTTAVALALSRGAALHLAVSMMALCGLFVFIIRDPLALRRLAVVGTLAAVSLPLITYYTFVRLGLWDLLIERSAYQRYDNERFGTQAWAISVSLEKPLGIGPGQWTFDRFVMDTHSLYLNVLAENGALGLLGILIFFAGCLLAGLRAVRRRDKATPLAAASLAICVGILAETLVIDALHWRHFFVFLAICVGLDAFARRERELKAPSSNTRPAARR